MNSSYMKKLTVAAFVAIAAISAKAGYLYWMVEQDPSSDEAIQFEYATIKQDGQTLAIYSPDGVELGTEVSAGLDGYNMDDGGYAMLSGATSGSTSFLVELWNASSDLVGWARYGSADVSGHIVDLFNTTGGTPLRVTQPALVPEPTCGILLLLGVAGLALRRRKAMFSMFAAFAATAALAAANDMLVSFSTKGPDRYADGSTVMDGECYALCWSKDFSQFSIKSDGTATGGDILLKAPVAAGGRCPTVMFEVSADLVGGKYADGEWAVYLLDTRSFAADGKAVVRGASAKSVNAFGRVSQTDSVGVASSGTLAGIAAAAGDVADGVDVPKPTITGIRVVGGNVYVSVKGTVPFLSYELSEGVTPGSVTEAVGKAAQGGVSASDEIILVAPAKKGGGFFKVGRQ